MMAEKCQKAPERQLFYGMWRFTDCSVGVLSRKALHRTPNEAKHSCWSMLLSQPSASSCLPSFAQLLMTLIFAHCLGSVYSGEDRQVGKMHPSPCELTKRSARYTASPLTYPWVHESNSVGLNHANPDTQSRCRKTRINFFWGHLPAEARPDSLS